MNRFNPWPHRPLALAVSCALSSFVAGHAGAQAVAAAAAPTTLEKVVVTGNPLGSAEIAAPVSVLTGDALVLRRGSTLGDTLNGLPGVSTTSFGPNASRPIIRGLDGDRVRILSNAGASLDASSLSFDHAVPIDPLIVERLEVLRGPGALMYGGSAMGGVVNALDNRIPKQPLNGTSGAVELRLGGAERERGGAALVETGNSAYALHADVFGRQTSDLQVPRYVPVQDGAPLPATTRVRNSAADTRGGAVGGSLFFGKNRLGLSIDSYDSTYGPVAEPDVSIRMKRDHLGVSGELKDLGGPFSSLRAQFNNTRYEHKEVDRSGAVGTVFKTSGNELRVEAEHAPLGPLRGVLGVQLEDFDFSALGDEAFVPSTRTRRQSVFALEEMGWAGGSLTGGLRLERARVDSDGDADPKLPRFGPAQQRSFSLRSASLANVYKLDAQWALTGAVSVSERAPTSFELYANGVHAATGTFERGDTRLPTERGSNLDVALQWKRGASHLRAGAFASSFSRFISLQASGNTIQEPDGQGGFNGFPEYVFKVVRARLHGVEIEGSQRLVDGPWTVDVSGKLDFTRARNADTGEALPRVAPLRLNIGLDAASGPWAGRIELDHAARQNRVPTTDVPTAGYSLVNLSLSRRLEFASTDALWFLKLGNLGNTLAYSASAIQTVRELAPLPGRSLKTGIRVAF